MVRRPPTSTHEEKGQLTAFMLLGLVIVGLVFFFTVMAYKLSAGDASTLQRQTQLLSERVPLEFMVDSCLWQKTSEAVGIYGMENNEFTRDSIVAYVEAHVPGCLDHDYIAEQGMSLEAGVPDADVAITEERVQVSLYYPLTLHLQGDTTEMEAFAYALPKHKSAVLPVDGNGVVYADTTISANDLHAHLFVPAGTVVRKNSLPLARNDDIAMEIIDTDSFDFGSEIVRSGVVYDLEDGVTFSPYAELTLSYVEDPVDDSYIADPEEELTVSWFDAHRGIWETLPVVRRDLDENTITVRVTHFTAFAVTSSLCDFTDDNVIDLLPEYNTKSGCTYSFTFNIDDSGGACQPGPHAGDPIELKISQSGGTVSNVRLNGAPILESNIQAGQNTLSFELTDGGSCVEIDSVSLSLVGGGLIDVDVDAKEVEGYPCPTPVAWNGATFKITSGWGDKRKKTGGGWATHEGVDIFGFQGGVHGDWQVGAPIYAISSGVVNVKDGGGRCGGEGGRYIRGCGLRVHLYQDDGWESLYCHLQKFASGLKTGDRVERGQVIGYLGSTGSACKSSPHLHFQLGPGGNWQNPRDELCLEIGGTGYPVSDYYEIPEGSGVIPGGDFPCGTPESLFALVNICEGEGGVCCGDGNCYLAGRCPSTPTWPPEGVVGGNPECNDNIDNDGDGKADYDGAYIYDEALDAVKRSSPDPDCANLNDDTEKWSPQCSDDKDNDGDNLVDYPADPDCLSIHDNKEATDVPLPPGAIFKCTSPIHDDICKAETGNVCCASDDWCYTAGCPPLPPPATPPSTSGLACDTQPRITLCEANDGICCSDGMCHWEGSCPTSSPPPSPTPPPLTPSPSPPPGSLFKCAGTASSNICRAETGTACCSTDDWCYIASTCS